MLITLKTASGHIQRGRGKSSDQHVPALLYVCALATVVSLEIKAPKTSYQRYGQADDTKQDLCSSKRECGLARSVEEVLS